MKKIILFIALMTMTLSFAQSKQVDKLLDNSEQGISTVYKDGTTVVKTVYNDAKSLSPKIELALKSLATELKTTTNALWDILVKQQLVWSIGFLILTLTSIFNWYLFYKRNLNIKLTEKDFVKGNRVNKKSIKNPEYTSYGGGERGKIFLETNDSEEEILIPIINTNNNWFKYLHLTICIGLSGLSIYHFSDMLTGFINPEFGALKTIAEIAIKLK
jgi:hypothetical protein